MAAPAYHNLAQMSVQFGDEIFTEFAEDGISWEPVNDAIVVGQGARGAVVMSEMFDAVSELTVRIMPGSPNEAIIDRIKGRTDILQVVDLNSDREIFSRWARVKRRPNIDSPMDLAGAAREIVFVLIQDRERYGTGNNPPG